MKSALYAVAGLLIFIGVVWILQGADILQGSFMTGQIEWLFAGILSLIIGIALVIFVRRRETNEPPPSTD
jgi:LPXTG-motif cell wall-anchored protein